MERSIDSDSEKPWAWECATVTFIAPQPKVLVGVIVGIEKSKVWSLPHIASRWPCPSVCAGPRSTEAAALELCGAPQPKVLVGVIVGIEKSKVCSLPHIVLR